MLLSARARIWEKLGGVEIDCGNHESVLAALQMNGCKYELVNEIMSATVWRDFV